MRLIIGLGNPGEKYEKTRHNIGFVVVEQFLKDFEPVRDTVWHEEPKFKADIAQIEWKPKVGPLEKVILAKPKTYMNNSGMSVRLLSDYYKVVSDDIWVIHDEVDLRLGSFRIRKGGGSAGHRGLESILGVFPDGNFWRFRCGIGRPEDAQPGQDHMANKKGIDGFVLGNFGHEEWSKMKELIKHAVKAIEMGFEEGLERSMNRYNTR